MSAPVEKALPGPWEIESLLYPGGDAQRKRERRLIENKIKAFRRRWLGKLRPDMSRQTFKMALEEFKALQELIRVEDTGDEQFASCARVYEQMLLNATNLNDVWAQVGLKSVLEWDQRQRNGAKFFLEFINSLPDEVRAEILADSALSEFWPWLRQQFMLPSFTPTRELLAAAQAADDIATPLAARLQTALGSVTAEVLTENGVQTLPFSAIRSLATSSDKGVRASAAAALVQILGGLKDLATDVFNATFESKLAAARARGGKPAEIRYGADAIRIETVQGMLDAAMGSLDLFHPFYRLMAGLLGYAPHEQLPYGERQMDWGTISQMPWDLSTSLLEVGFERMGSDLATVVEALKHGRIDAESRVGRDSKTACYWSVGRPSVLAVDASGANWGTFMQRSHETIHCAAAEEVSVLRHGLSYNTRVPTAEATAVMGQLFMAVTLDDKLALDDETKLAVMVAQLRTQLSTALQQSVAVCLEQELYDTYEQNGPLTAEQISEMFVRYMRLYFGDAVAMDELAELYWIAWPQLLYGFYNPAYAFAGMVATAGLEIYRTNPEAALKVLHFMIGAGGMDTVEEICRMAGIPLGPDLWARSIASMEQQLKAVMDLARRLHPTTA